VVSGVFSASFTIANAYIADVTPPEDRARSYGIVGAAFGMGLVFGPVLGGQLSHIDPRLPFWFAAGLTLLSFCYGWFVLPESLPPERRSRKFDWSHANPLGSLVLLRRYPQVFGLAAVIFLVNLAQYVYPSVFVLFADYRYHWKEDAVGWVLGAVGVLSVLVNALLIGPGVKRFGERRALLFGMGFGVLGFVVYGFADAGWVLLAATAVGHLAGVRRTGGAGAGHPRGRRRRARPHPGGAHEPGVGGGHRRAGDVRRQLRLFHRRGRAGAPAGRALLHRRGVPLHRHADRVALRTAEGGGDSGARADLMRRPGRALCAHGPGIARSLQGFP
jgi:MFS family permease